MVVKHVSCLIRQVVRTAYAIDDLLQCDCQAKSKGLSERPENLPSPLKDGEEDDSDDEGIKGFQHACQYDPAPVSHLVCCLYVLQG